MSETLGILEIRMLGNFDILYDGKSIFNVGKHVNKIFEILKYMIINNEKELSPEIICESIWPDKEYMDVRNTVTTYIFRLNKFLKSGNSSKIDVSQYLRIACQKGAYKLAISEKSLLDIKRFSTLYEKFEKEQNEENKIDLMRDAMALYRGELLADSGFDSWITPFRNYYRRMFLEINRNILSAFIAQGNHKEVLKICKEVFEIYPLDEFANQQYLRALSELTYYSEAITHYEYISSRYISELGVQPTREMRELYQAMKNRDQNSQNDAVPSGNNYAQLFSENSEFWKLFSNAIDDYMDKNAETKSYSIGYATLGTGRERDFDKAVESLQNAIQNVLRKEDCYTFFKPNIFVFVLNDVSENYFNLIKDRIKNVFKTNYTKNIFFDININPSF
jgi:DNA-binding SARP family transcriptional activator